MTYDPIPLAVIRGGELVIYADGKAVARFSQTVFPHIIRDMAGALAAEPASDGLPKIADDDGRD